MDRLHCSWHELQAMPAGVLTLFRAFIKGEADAIAARKK